jgi:hypothetical protein
VIAETRKPELGETHVERLAIGGRRLRGAPFEQVRDVTEAALRLEQRQEPLVDFARMPVALFDGEPGRNRRRPVARPFRAHDRRADEHGASLSGVLDRIGALREHVGEPLLVTRRAVERLQAIERLVVPGRGDERAPSDDGASRVAFLRVGKAREPARRGLARLALWLELHDDLERLSEQARFLGFRVELGEARRCAESRHLVRTELEHLLERRLRAAYVARLQIHLAHVRGDARAHGRVAVRRQRPREEPSRLRRLVELEAQRDETPAEIVVSRIAGDDRPEQLERASRVAEHVLAQRTEPPLHLDAPGPAHLLELEAQHGHGLVDFARRLVRVRESGRRAQPELAMLDELFGELSRVRVHRIEHQEPFDVEQRALRVAQDAETDVHRLFAKQRRFLRRRRRLALERRFELVHDFLVPAARDEALNQILPNALRGRIQREQRGADLDGEVPRRFVA